MIVFAHTKFGLVQIQGSGVKRGAESAPPPRSERVFQIPVQIGLKLPFPSKRAMDFTTGVQTLLSFALK